MEQAMIWEKKSRQGEPKNSDSFLTAVPVYREPAITSVPAESGKAEKLMADTTQASVMTSSPGQNHTVLGGTIVWRGELSGDEDVLIEGQVDGNIDVQNHCVTVGPQGRITADIQGGQVIVLGRVEGKIAARGKIDLRKTAFVIGDLSSAALAIEEGAYFKGSIEIIRDSVTAKEVSPRSPAAGAVTAQASA
jgi:cytoskeletal protein CcmA (bactofilin family)